MATIIYLDVEDEITSAATRIRTAGETRVALVLPFGSRLSTSRINFRLLAREALVNGRRLDVIAPDASARALAASAGLPVFASIGEYESAQDGAPSGSGPGVAADAAATAILVDAATGGAGGAGAAAGAGGASAATTLVSGVTTVASGPRPRSASSPRTPEADPAPSETEPGAGQRGEPRVVHARRRLPGAGAIMGLGILVLAVVVAGGAAFVFLPSADIVVRPRIEPIGPISLDVQADPAASAVDAEAGVIPAQVVEVPVETSTEFPATGKRIEETTASGGVRLTNCDPSASYTIPRGTTVRTRSGVAFTTDEVTFLPVAALSGSPPNVKVKCQSSEVAVTAAKAGPSGNVDAGAIRVIPARYDRNLISVTNPAATDGGAREEFARVSQKDVDAALKQLALDLEAQFASAVEDGAGAPAGSTVFPGTATLGEPSPTVDPATLVGQEGEAFTLGLTATGQVLAVDASPVEAIVEARLAGSIKPGYSLMDGSTQVEVGEGSVVDGIVSFPASGSAQQVRPLDAEALRAEVLGLGEAEAAEVLGQYGNVELVLWPDWVSTVPPLPQRVTVVVGEPVPSG